MEEYRHQYEVNDGEMGVAFVSDAIILPVRRIDDPVFDFGLGGVVNNVGEIVTNGECEELVGRGYSIPQLLEKEKKTVVYCGYFQQQWGHFLMQSCNRLWFAIGNPEGIDEYIFTVDEGVKIPEINGTNYGEFFKLLGIADKLKFINAPRRYAEVILPQESFAITHYVRSGFALLFNELKHRVSKLNDRPEERKIMLGRSSFAKARKMEMGLIEMEEHFRSNGYEVVYPEKISLTKFISLLSSATEIVTFSGSLAHNLVFAPAGAKVTVIERYPYVNYFQTAIELAFDFDMTYVDANAFIRPVSPGLGPFIYYSNIYFKEYCRQRGLTGMSVPTDYECRRMVRKFLRLYAREYDKKWKMPVYYEEHIPDMKDALVDSASVFNEKRYCPVWFRISVRLSPYILIRSVYRGLRAFILKSFCP